MEIIQQMLGIGAASLTWYQTALRAVIVYIAALAMVRLGEKRFLGKNTALDVIIGIVLGSVVSRAINSTETILPTLVAGFVLVGLHTLLSVITFHSDQLGDVLKGTPRLLVKNGEILWNAMQKSHISRQDLLQQMRSGKNTEDIQSVQKAYLERSGDISVITAKGEPKVLEVSVAEGVQTIRIKLKS